MSFPDILHGAVWHTTTPDRYDSIVRDGFVLPEPPLDDLERWGTASGSGYYPFVRSLGGVSLFDFRNFDAITYNDKYPMSMWRSFVPCTHRSNSAVWIEIAFESLGEKFVSGIELLERWKTSGQLSRKIMPLIEAAHIGPLPLSSFRRVLRFEGETNVFVPLAAVA